MDCKELKIKRIELELTQTQLGKIIWPQISAAAAQSRIKRIESGKRKISNKEKDMLKSKPSFDLSQESAEEKEYEYVIKIYPEIESFIKLLYYAHPEDSGCNFELAATAWEGLSVISKQKSDIFKTIYKKRIKKSS